MMATPPLPGMAPRKRDVRLAVLLLLVICFSLASLTGWKVWSSRERALSEVNGHSLNLTQALAEITSDAKRISYSSDLKLGCLFVAPQKAQHGATPEELQDMVDDLQKEHSCAVAWYFPYAYRKLRNEAGNYHPGIAVLFKEAHG